MNELELTQLSQLCDGELDNTAMVGVLLNVLDSPEAKERPQTESQRTLRDLLRLRQTTAAWRNREPTKTILPTSPMITLDKSSRPMTNVAVWVATAACAVCLLLMGVVVGQYLNVGTAAPEVLITEDAPELNVSSQVVRAERRRQLAEVFAFHESVVGPLSWYAAAENAEDLAMASGDPQSAPVGLVLRFTTQGQQPESQEYTIVCRDRSSASIKLPGSGPGEEPVLVRLTPITERGEIALQYCVVLPGAPGIADAMGLSGRRSLGANLDELGEFAFDAKSIRVEASAWLLEGAGA